MSTMKVFESLKKSFLANAPSGMFCSLRFVQSDSEEIAVRQNVFQPVESGQSKGFMITILDGTGSGYAASSDLTEAGVKNAINEAVKWADFNKKYSLIDYSKIDLLHPEGEYCSDVKEPWQSKALSEKIDLVKSLNADMKTDDKIVDWISMIMFNKHHSFYVTNGGGSTYQSYDYMVPYMSLIAAEGSQVQKRSLDSFAVALQGGAEALETVGFNQDTAKRLGREAVELLKADNCPTGKMDLILDPGQMTLQIHESIGHPLEIDRILGDERNYAGTSFVTPDMFGNFQYGSELLNIAFDPSRKEQFATYAFDDDGVECKKEYLIERGILKRGLGSNISQARSGLPGVANSKAQSWNRAPIDRMANINLEAGCSSFDDMISSVEKGVYMMTNTSWSIDDSRNKFQFGCEWGRMIEHGKLTKLVRNPNYRGISKNFWRNLKMVGDENTFRVLGTPNCGKGEPNQVALVGHATPTCLFTYVDVFGGE